MIFIINRHITMPELLKFISEHLKKPCPSCGGERWEVLTDEDGPLLTMSNTVKARWNVGQEVVVTPSNGRPTVDMSMRCQRCGYLHHFDYLFILKRIEEEKDDK